MTEAWRLKVWTRFLAPPEAVWRLKTDPEALAAEFRPWIWFTMSAQDRGVVSDALSRSGREACVSARLWPPGIQWEMNLEVVEPGRVYRDCSSNRLYQQWDHRHEILPASDGTLYIDDVRFVPALGAPKAMARLTRTLFEYRHRRAARSLPTERGTVGVAVLRLDCPSDAG